MGRYSIRISIYDQKLFDGESLLADLDQRLRRAVAEVARVPAEQILAMDSDAWIEDKVAGAMAPRLVLRPERAALEPRGIERPLLVVPFEGPEELFELDPEKPADARVYHRSPRPQGVAQDGELRCELPVKPKPDVNLEAVIERKIAEYTSWVDKVNARIGEHEQMLRAALRKRLDERIAAEHDASQFFASSPLPIRRRSDAPRVFRDEPIVRRPTPDSGRSRESTQKRKAEPALNPELYDHILSVVRAAGRAMTRSPATYAGWGEEDRRQALLLILNTHYAGQAHAEAFNFTGKTDILVRLQDRNVFIAECLIWGGPKSLTAKLDQLLGYATWHDTKLALIAFVGRRDLTAVIHSGRDVLSNHAQHVSWLESTEENEMRCEITWPGDKARSATLHVFFIHTPTDGGAGR
jgi:hypothetical protein